MDNIILQRNYWVFLINRKCSSIIIIFPTMRSAPVNFDLNNINLGAELMELMLYDGIFVFFPT